MKFPPINLWSKPYQEQFDKELDNITSYSVNIDALLYMKRAIECEMNSVDEQLKKANERLKELSFLHYLRTGRHLIK